jgi:hypothetical protein
VVAALVQQCRGKLDELCGRRADPRQRIDPVAQLEVSTDYPDNIFVLAPYGSGGTTVTVLPPLAGQVTLTSATEGTALPGSTTVATFTDVNTGDAAADFTATIAWGDGTTTSGTVSGGNGSFIVEGGHTYADEGSDPLAVTITDAQNNFTITPSGTVTVGEGDTLVANPTSFAATADTPFSGIVASFTDTTYPGNVASDFTATINWGDGTTTAGTVGGGSGSPFTVSGSHTYTDAGAGIDTVAVRLNDDPPGTATATADSTAIVAAVFTPNAPPPAGTTADLILRDGGNGIYEIYDLGNKQILEGYPLGQVGTDYVFAGLGDFNGADTTDMLLRSSSATAFEVYDIANNNITAAAPLGQVGVEWQAAGFGDFNGAGGGTDMMLREPAHWSGVFGSGRFGVGRRRLSFPAQLGASPAEAGGSRGPSLGCPNVFIGWKVIAPLDARCQRQNGSRLSPGTASGSCLRVGGDAHQLSPPLRGTAPVPMIPAPLRRASRR